MQLRRFLVSATVVLSGVALVVPQAASAQTDPTQLTTTTTEGPTTTTAPPDTTTTSTSTTSTTLPVDGSTTTTTSSPNSTTTTAPLAPAAPPPDDPNEATVPVPTEVVVVPPRDTPRTPTAIDLNLTKIVTTQVNKATQQLNVASAANQQATSKAVLLAEKLATAEVRLNELQLQQRLALIVVSQKRYEVTRRAVAAYTSGGVNRINELLSVKDFNDFTRRAHFIDAVAKLDKSIVADWVNTRSAANADLGKEVTKVDKLRSQVQSAQSEASAANDAFTQSQSSVDALRYGQAIAVNGFVFPVAGPHSFTDTFGAPRMPGTPFAHKHQGNDIFADLGTPLVACERGVVFHMSTDFLGGLGLWVVGESGTRYYYAHLSQFAAGLHDGQVVEGGDLVGYVGDTGNAKGGAMHLHFEIHPNGGPAIDPYALLKAADDAAQAAGVARSAAPTP